MGFSEPILHVDMDAFFVEVERLYDPSLLGRPVVVGGLGDRGVVASASYEARALGVRSAMPIVRARQLCPGAVFVPPDHRKYATMSRRVFEILEGVTPFVEALSIDEGFLDVGGLSRHHPTAVTVGEEIRMRLRDSLGLPASVGVARNKFLAKLASAKAKPDGLVIVPAGEEDTFLKPLPISDLWGVGQATRALLERLGVATVGELAALSADLLCRRLGPTLGDHLWRLANGIDLREVEVDREARSVSAETTFERDLTGRTDMERELLRLSDRVGRRLRGAGLRAGTVTLKLRYADFATITRSRTPPDAVDLTDDIFAVARALLRDVELRPVRLLGIGVGKLQPSAAPHQLVLAGRDADPLTAAVDEVRDRFGEDAVRPARLIEQRPPVE